MKIRERNRSASWGKGAFVVGVIVATIVASPVWSAGEALEQGFLNPPPQAYPGGGIRIANDPNALRSQLERQKQLGIRHLSVGSEGAPGAYMSEPWKTAISSTVLTAQQMGFEVSFMTSPGFSHTGDSQIQPQEAMKKLVWTEAAVSGGQAFTGKLAAPPNNTGPFQNIPFFSESPWTIAIDKEFYRDVTVIAYKVPQSNTITARPVVTSNQGSIDAAKLSANDPRKPLTIEGPSSGNGNAWLQLDYPTPQTVRSVVLTTPETLFEGSVIANLLAKVDGSYKTIGTFDMRSIAQVTLSFPGVRSSSFRLEFSRLPQSVEPLVPKGGDDFVMNMSVLPFGPKRPPYAYAISALMLSSENRVNEFERKAGFFTFVNDYYALSKKSDASAVTSKAEVIDLTGRMQADGTLNWSPPAGHWKVLRVGYSLTGKINHPAPPDATGLEVDKLSATHMSKYINRYLDGLIPAGEARKGVSGLFADSIESGPQNWTEEMIGEFKKRRGYDMRPFFPTLTGAVVQSAAATDKFLWDYRQTIADLIHENTFAKLSEIAHTRGLKVRAQALEQARHQLGDDFEMRRYADEPMGALWASADPVLDYLKLYPNQVADQRGAASVAHVYGRKIVAAESGTTMAFPGAFSPRVLKQIVDLEFAIGVNWLSQGAPTPRDTWVNYAQEWVKYLARSSYLLQQGHYVADVAYYYGQDAPLVTQRERLNDAPLQYGYDYINTQALLNQVSVKDGKLATPSGMEYRVLQLGGSSNFMTVNVLRRLRDLVAAGLIVAGKAPTDTPSLADDAAEFGRLKAQLWGTEGKGSKVGKGRVYGSLSIADVLSAANVTPDMSASRDKVGIKVGDTILFQHRKTDDADFYYVMNRGEQPGPIEFSFRQSGKAPELWRADTGERTAISYRIENGRTIVPIDLRLNDAMFVVFRHETKANAFSATRTRTEPVAELSTDWNLSLGANAQPQKVNAGSWTDSGDPKLKFFAGTATYARTIDIPASAFSGAKLMLNLGEVQDIADVSVNGSVVGVRWTPPYTFDVTAAVKPGANKIEIKVTNRAVNGMIGASQPKADGTPAAPMGFGAYKPDAPLRASGLIGPVQLLSTAP